MTIRHMSVTKVLTWLLVLLAAGAAALARGTNDVAAVDAPPAATGRVLAILAQCPGALSPSVARGIYEATGEQEQGGVAASRLMAWAPRGLGVPPCCIDRVHVSGRWPPPPPPPRPSSAGTRRHALPRHATNHLHRGYRAAPPVAWPISPRAPPSRP